MSLRVMLKMAANGEARASAPFFSDEDGMPSMPVAFFDFSSLSAFRVSDKVISRSNGN